MPLINCEVKLKLRQTKHCVSSVLGNEDDTSNANYNKYIFTIKDTKLHVPVITYEQKAIKNYQKLLAKDLKDQFI